MTREKGREKGRDRLGRGLAALLGESMQAEEQGEAGRLRELPVNRISANPFQPRREFDPGELEDLARSIDENGLLQPLIVRATGPREEPRYQLVAGERRLRAVNHLGWERVPVVIRDVDDRTLLVLALVENLQREALNPLEEAEGYRVLAREFELTQAEIAQAVGKNRSTVANTLRLLDLPPSIRKLVEKGALTAGHARALLAVEDGVRAAELARKAVSREWSVREVERRVRALKRTKDGPEDEGEKPPSSPAPERSSGDPALRRLREEMRTSLSTRVEIRRKASGGGVIEIPFHDGEDFERLFAAIVGRETDDVLG